MKKYFIVSDVHSFYSELKTSLDNVGFDIKNKNHIFVLCGDLFDRGDETKELYEFVMSIPKERRILIRGNHEYLLKELVDKYYPESHDFSNGTAKTMCDMVGADLFTLRFGYMSCYENDNLLSPSEYWANIVKEFKDKKIVEWIFSDEWVDYFELENLICVHSFIPLNDDSCIPAYFERGHNYSYNKDWRKLDTLYWEDASWGCPYKLFDQGLFQEEINKGKILVCGHWHTRDFHKYFNGDSSESNFEMYVGDNLIALDGCTAYTYNVNVLVVKETNKDLTLSDKFNNVIRTISKK